MITEMINKVIYFTIYGIFCRFFHMIQRINCCNLKLPLSLSLKINFLLCYNDFCVFIRYNNQLSIKYSTKHIVRLI